MSDKGSDVVSPSHRCSNDAAKQQESNNDTLLLLAEATTMQKLVSCDTSPLSSANNNSIATSPPSVQTDITRIVTLDSVYPELKQLNILLKRHSLSQRWGFSISLFDQLCLAVGWVDPSVFSVCLSTNLDAQKIDSNERNFTQIQSGDLIVSINDIPVLKFDTVDAVKEYVSKHTFLSLSILRYPPSADAARAMLEEPLAGSSLQLYTGKTSAVPTVDAASSSRASHAAYIIGFRALQRYLLWTSQQPTYRPLVIKSNSTPCNSANFRSEHQTSSIQEYNSEGLHSVEDYDKATDNLEFSSAPPGLSLNILKSSICNRKVHPYLHQWQCGTDINSIHNPPFPHKKSSCKVQPEYRRYQWKSHFHQALSNLSMIRDLNTAKVHCSEALLDAVPCLLTMKDLRAPNMNYIERANQFMSPFVEKDFYAWLAERKLKWRKQWKIYSVSSPQYTRTPRHSNDINSVPPEREFWKIRGFPTFAHWLMDSTKKWKRTYSWNLRKRKLFEMESEKEVSLPYDPNDPAYTATLHKWLRVRKSQWKIYLRKRQRQKAEENSEKGASNLGINREATVPGTRTNFEDVYIDMLLEDQEKTQRDLKNQPPLDISFLFDASLGSDDLVGYIVSFLHPLERWKLLFISKSTGEGMRMREEMWKSLCPSHWTLPKKPRKPWYLIYINKTREEEDQRRKLSDDVLVRAQDIILKGDHVGKIEKLVNISEKKFNFSIDYTSCVVLERNSLLNIAVIYNRHKIVRWLIEAKDANIETSDRGQFTPLINAAWAGNKYLVCYLMRKGANRTAQGTGHYTTGLAPYDFKGFTAEGWARKRGHDNVAEIIRLGL